MNYYNEFDPHAAAWLRELIRADLIPAGEVDERSIEDVTPNDLRGFVQHHFFAGIAGWPHALDLAGWPRDRPVWTGSCPCQSFSAAGKGAGFADQRHLWPAWFHLIRECRPQHIFGEQVAAAIRHGWLDLVSADMEGAGYAVGSAVLGAHSVGAPHIRQRLYFVAESHGKRARVHTEAIQARQLESGRRGVALGDTSGPRLAQQFGERGTSREAAGRHESEATERAGSPVGAVGHADSRGSAPGNSAAATAGHRDSADTAGFWSGAEWIACRDGKARPVKPGLQCLADGVPARVVRLRGFGNAIVPQQAAAFIRAYLECEADRQLSEAA